MKKKTYFHYKKEKQIRKKKKQRRNCFLLQPLRKGKKTYSQYKTGKKNI